MTDIEEQRLVLPGDQLRAMLLEHQISQQEFADIIRVSRLTVNQIITNRRSITAEVALRIAKATKTKPEYWLSLQQQIDIKDAQRRIRGELRKVPLLRKRR